MSAQVDHLVITASTLGEGVMWCEETLGVTPGPGGKHPLMGTHNRLLSIATPAFPNAYLEIIAIDPETAPPQRRRWFGLDDRSVGQAPSLVHWVARTNTLDVMRQNLLNIGLNPGDAVAAERDTPQGLLRWRILVRGDGRLECGGVLPTLIEWLGRHPAAAMPDVGLRLESLSLLGLPASAPTALQLENVHIESGPPWRLKAVLQTPRGNVALESLE